MKDFIDKLKEKLKNDNIKETIESYEEQLNKNIEELSKNENFFNLPLNILFSVISKVNFNEIEEKDKIIEIIRNIINNIIKTHFEEKETILVLSNINIPTNSLTYKQLFSILELFNNCSLINNFCSLFKKQNQYPKKDFGYEIKQRDDEIEKLKQICSSQEEIAIKEEKIKTDNIFTECEKGDLLSVQWLIEKEKVDVNKKDENGEYLLHIAAINGHLDIIKYLIEKQNVYIDIKGKSQKTALIYASEKGDLDIVEYLLSKGANIESMDYYYKTALHYACEYCKIPVIGYLVLKGADIEVKDYNSKTPLIYGCDKGNIVIVNFLISKGADIDAQDINGNTPLHYASFNGKTNIVKYLLSKGADKNIENKFHQKP